MKKVIFTLSCLVIAAQSQAGGYRVSIQGQQALGMGHTGVAMSNSAESVFFNPGAITQLEGKVNVVGGITGIFSENRYQNEDTNTRAEADNPLGIPVNFYLTTKFSEQMTYGFGIYTPFGSKVEWDRDWAGSHLVNEIELRSIFFQPTIAYEMNNELSLGFGAIAAVSSVDINRNLSTSLQNADGDRSNVTLEDSGIVDYGYSIGAFFQVNEKLDLGLNYRSEITVNSEGDADFDNVPVALQSVFVDGGYEAELPLPAELTIGLTYQYSDKLLLAADYNYTFWDAYETLLIEFDSVTDPNSATSDNPRNYKNSNTYRIGLEYQKNNNLTLRGGMYYDETPIRDGYFAPETPRTNSLGFTAGMTYAFNNRLSIDASALYLYFDEEDNAYDFNAEGPFEGTYKVNVWSLGLGLSYKL